MAQRGYMLDRITDPVQRAEAEAVEGQVYETFAAVLEKLPPIPETDFYLHHGQVVDQALHEHIRAAERMFTNKPQCKAGCASCCKVMQIIAVDIEVQKLVHFVETAKNRDFLVHSLRKERKPTENRKPTEHRGTTTPCAFLSPGDKCVAHAARPVNCILYNSSSASACRRYERGDSNDGPPVMLQPYLINNALYDLYIAPLREKTGLATKGYEMNSVMRRIYTTEGMPERVLRGDFSGLEDLVVSRVKLDEAA